MSTGKSNALFFLVVGAALFFIFGSAWLLRLPRNQRTDYGSYMVAIARIVWPLALIIMIVSGVAFVVVQ